MEAGRDRIKQLEGYYGRRGKIIENKDNSGIKRQIRSLYYKWKKLSVRRPLNSNGIEGKLKATEMNAE